MRLRALSSLIAPSQIVAHCIDAIEWAALDVAPVQRVVRMTPRCSSAPGVRRLTAATSNAVKLELPGSVSISNIAGGGMPRFLRRRFIARDIFLLPGTPNT